jgi:hypothetical protein
VSREADSFLLKWACVSLALLGIIAALPETVLPRSPPQSVLEGIVVGAIAIVIAGFYLRLLFEVISRRRFRWLVLFFALPIFSAYIYFMVTRFQPQETA